jgi:hypothetical protein
MGRHSEYSQGGRLRGRHLRGRNLQFMGKTLIGRLVARLLAHERSLICL